HKCKGQYDRAIADDNKAIEINPGCAQAYTNRGLTFASKRQYDQAISDYNKAIELNPRLAQTYYNRGLAYSQGKAQYAQAISDFTRAIEINPRYAAGYKGRGLNYMILGNMKKACSDLKQLCTLGDCRVYQASRAMGKCD
ncbi:MAG: tetratricopeptide repeat protein, partial [Syntrophobacterales bacterium]